MPKGERGRKPDFRVTAMNMDTQRKGPVGAAWKNPDGSISMVLDPWVCLQGDGYSLSKISIMLWPDDWKPAPQPAPEPPEPLDFEDDIPF